MTGRVGVDLTIDWLNVGEETMGVWSAGGSVCGGQRSVDVSVVLESVTGRSGFGGYGVDWVDRRFFRCWSRFSFDHGNGRRWVLSHLGGGDV
jgi:hypothetical protein